MQSVTAVTGQMPGASADGEIVLLERVFKQRRIGARPGAGQQSSPENLLGRSNVAFLRKDIPAGVLEELTALCADMIDCYMRVAKLCEADAASYALCVAAHKRSALLSDAQNRLRGLRAAAIAPHEKRKALAVVFEALSLGPDDGADVIGRDFKKCLNQDALPVAFRVSLAVLFARITQSLRQAGAIKRAVDES